MLREEGSIHIMWGPSGRKNQLARLLKGPRSWQLAVRYSPSGWSRLEGSNLGLGSIHDSSGFLGWGRKNHRVPLSIR